MRAGLMMSKNRAVVRSLMMRTGMQQRTKPLNKRQTQTINSWTDYQAIKTSVMEMPLEGKERKMLEDR